MVKPRYLLSGNYFLSTLYILDLSTLSTSTRTFIIIIIIIIIDVGNKRRGKIITIESQDTRLMESKMGGALDNDHKTTASTGHN